MGFRFHIDGEWHYGWLVMEVEEDLTGMTIFEYAYETEANKMIHAGDFGTSVDQIDDADPFEITSNNGGVSIESESNDLINIQIHDLSGNLIEQGNFYNQYEMKYKSERGIYFRIIQVNNKIYRTKNFNILD
jgi:hypothetical protein